MKAFILAVSLTTILTTSAVAAAMRYLDQMQDSLAARTAPAVYLQTRNSSGQAVTPVALKGW